MRLASTYPLYGIANPLSLWDATNPQLKDPQPRFWAERFSQGRDLGPSILQCHHLYPFCHKSSLISCAKELGLWYLGSAIGLCILTNVPGSPPPGSLSWGAGWMCLLPHTNFCLKFLDNPRPYDPNSHSRTFFPSVFPFFMTVDCYLCLLYCFGFYFYFFHSPMVEGCQMWFFGWPLNCHPQLCNLFFQTCNVIFPLQLTWSHWESLPSSVLLLWHSFMGHCHKLRLHYHQVIVEIVHRIA